MGTYIAIESSNGSGPSFGMSILELSHLGHHHRGCLLVEMGRSKEPISRISTTGAGVVVDVARTLLMKVTTSGPTRTPRRLPPIRVIFLGDMMF